MYRLEPSRIDRFGMGRHHVYCCVEVQRKEVRNEEVICLVLGRMDKMRLDGFYKIMGIGTKDNYTFTRRMGGKEDGIVHNGH